MGQIRQTSSAHAVEKRQYSAEEFALLEAVRDAISAFVAGMRSRPVAGRVDASGVRPIRLLAAVSGGCDSVVMLDALQELQRTEATLASGQRIEIEMGVAHLNHALRDQSAADENFVRSLAGASGLPYFAKIAPQVPPGENLEAWGRAQRYGFFDSICKEFAFDAVCTAHHLNDQAETLLMRLLSGRMLTDAHAIAGISRNSAVVRPLLAVPRASIEAYSASRGLSFVQDLTNGDTAFTRNRIRHELLPLLAESYNPRIVETAAGIAERLGDDESALEAAAKGMCVEMAGCAERTFLRTLLPALKWRYLRVLAEKQIGGDARLLGYEAYRIVAEAIDDTNGAQRSFDLGFGIQAKLNRTEAVFLKADARKE